MIYYRRLERTLQTSKTSIVLRDLKDWLKYRIEVEGYTANGTGSYAYFDFKTPTIPGPTGVNITKINANTLEVLWDPIPEEQVRGAILGYKVQLREHYSYNLVQMHKTNTTRIIISQIPFRTYLYLVIQGFTSNDTTQATYYRTSYLYLDPIPYVSGLKVAVNGTTAVATWDPIPRKFVFGELLGYRVRVYQYYFGKIHNDTKTNKTNIVLRDLQLGYAYRISVAGYTSNETGYFSYQGFLTGCGGVIKHQLNGKIELKYFDYYHWHWLNNINCTWYIQGGNSNSLILINVDTLDVRFSNCRESYLRISDGQGQPITTLCRTTTRSLTFAAFGSVKIQLFLGRWWWWWRFEIALSFFIINSGLNNTFVKDSWSVSVSNTTSTSMEVQWSAYPGKETVKNFIAVCTSQNKHTSIFTATTDRNQSKAVVTNLLKNTEYKVEVVAFLKRSSNASYRNVTSLNSTVWKSQSVIARSLEDVPSKPPDNVKAVSSGPTSVLVSWNTLVDSNGVIVGYNVYHQKSYQGQNSSVMVRVHSNTTKFQFKNLQQATEYKISVTALTRVGEGPSRSVYVTTGFHQTLSHSSGKFESPNYPKNYPTSADYTWDIAPARVFDKLYILFWEFDLEGDRDSCNDFVKVSDNKGNDLLLTCGRKSRFAVVATRSAVIKLQSDKGIEKSGFTATYFTLDNINRVINVNVKSMTDTQVSVQWNSPSAYRPCVFTIFYRKHESIQVWNFTLANNTYATIRGLESSTFYELLVTGSNNVTSYESHSVTFVTRIATTTRPTEEKPTEPMSLMYEYGVNASDQTIPNTWRYTQYCKRVTLNEYGFLFMAERHREVYICRNGVLRFESHYYVHWPVYLGSTEQSCQLKMLAPYWCLADRSQSTVYYHVYQTSDKSTKSNKVLQQATDDVIKLHKGTLPASFKASWVLVVTWENLRHLTQNKDTKDLKNTFQAVLITDGLASFAMYNYPIDGIQWSAPTTRNNWDHFSGSRGLPVVGWIAGKCDNFGLFNVERSATVTIGKIDTLEGFSISNNLSHGVLKLPHSFQNKWVFQLYMPWRYSLADIKCKNWFKDQPDPRPFLEYLEPCPCTSRQAWFDERFTPEKSSSRWSWWSNPRPCAISTFTSRDGWEQKCCYSHHYSEWGTLIVGHPNGGYAHRFSHIKASGDHANHDVKGYDRCCLDSNLCHLFYQRRPSDDCSRYEPPEWRLGREMTA